MSAVTAVLLTLAVFRLAIAIAYERGPFGIFDGLRTAVTLRLRQGHWFTEGINCPKCISFWLALLAALATSQDTVTAVLAVWFGFAGGAFLLTMLHDYMKAATIKALKEDAPTTVNNHYSNPNWSSEFAESVNRHMDRQFR